jgi:cytoskeletal protein RodZ
MAEKQTIVEVTGVQDGKSVPSTRSSREPFFGTLLFGVLVLVMLGVISLLSWWGYRGWSFSQEQSALPSIAALPITEEKTESRVPVEEEKPQTQEPSQEELVKKTKETDIKVLNGGAAKGSAGVLGEALKKEGYTKISVGNTTGNYTGTIIYFASGLDQEAATLKASLLKSHPKTEAKPALTDNKETTQAPLTVILGKE